MAGERLLTTAETDVAAYGTSFRLTTVSPSGARVSLRTLTIDDSTPAAVVTPSAESTPLIAGFAVPTFIGIVVGGVCGLLLLVVLVALVVRRSRNGASSSANNNGGVEMTAPPPSLQAASSLPSFSNGGGADGVVVGNQYGSTPRMSTYGDLALRDTNAPNNYNASGSGRYNGASTHDHYKTVGSSDASRESYLPLPLPSPTMGFGAPPPAFATQQSTYVALRSDAHQDTSYQPLGAGAANNAFVGTYGGGGNGGVVVGAAYRESSPTSYVAVPSNGPPSRNNSYIALPRS